MTDPVSPFLSINRGARIRTGDPLLPKQVRYRTAPRPVIDYLHAEDVLGQPASMRSPSAKGRTWGLRSRVPGRRVKTAPGELAREPHEQILRNRVEHLL